MGIVFLTAFGVGGATIIGSIIGFAFKNISHRFSDIVLSFAGGIMLSASVWGLIIPSVEYGGKYGIFVTVCGILTGAICLNLFDKLVPHLQKLLKTEMKESESTNINKILLFVISIAIHNLPEGIAAGVGFGSGDTKQALMIAGGIALQNIPEGMVIIPPMLAAGISPEKAFVIGMFTGIIEIAGTIAGYFTITISTAILPFVLAFAGGTMLYVISNDMIPETHSHGSDKGATYSFLIGFCVMLVSDVLLV